MTTSPAADDVARRYDPFTDSWYDVPRARLEDVELVRMGATFRLVREAEEFGRRYLGDGGRPSFAANVTRVDSRTWTWTAAAHERDVAPVRAVYQYVADLLENVECVGGKSGKIGFTRDATGELRWL